MLSLLPVLIAYLVAIEVAELQYISSIKAGKKIQQVLLDKVGNCYYSYFPIDLHSSFYPLQFSLFKLLKPITGY